MENSFINYRIGVKKLLETLGKEHEKYLDAINFQHQLVENIEQVESFGDNENHRSTRYRILNQIEQLALATLGEEFFKLCKPESIKIQSSSYLAQNDTVWHEFQEPEMCLIPPGAFIMGSPQGLDSDAAENEYPLHVVNLPAFYIATKSITNLQFAIFVINTKHPPPDHWNGKFPFQEIHNHPVVNISWYSAIEFCNWLRDLTHKAYRLPTEAEWEKAARGEYGFLFPWGNKWEDNHINTLELGLGRTVAVDEFPNATSPYGLRNMAGNVYEWTSSLWGQSGHEPFRYPYNIADSKREALDAPSDFLRIIRGGSFSWDKKYARCASRSKFPPNRYRKDIGFRLALSPEQRRNNLPV